MALEDTIDAFTDWTPAQLKLAAKQAMVTGSIAMTNSLNGRTVTRISIEDAIKLYDWAVQLEQVEDETLSGGTALVQYGERV